jgi:hypothetical protein
MNTYIAFYRGQRIEVRSDTTYHAQLKAAEILKAKHAWDVTVMLARLADGTIVVHVPDF